jgi:hypothetical protein
MQRHSAKQTESIAADKPLPVRTANATLSLMNCRGDPHDAGGFANAISTAPPTGREARPYLDHNGQLFE